MPRVTLTALLVRAKTDVTSGLKWIETGSPGSFPGTALNIIYLRNSRIDLTSFLFREEIRCFRGYYVDTIRRIKKFVELDLVNKLRDPFPAK